jgi:autotransporter-associated beta strand protein
MCGTSPSIGEGTLVLSGANSYAGATSVASGTLQMNAGGSLPSATALTVASAAAGGIFNMNSVSQTIASLASSTGINGTGTTTPSVKLGSGTLTLTGAGVSTAFAGVISGTGGSLNLGSTFTSSTLTLSKANTYTGGTTINAGTLDVTGSIAGNVTDNGGVLELGKTTSLASTATLTLNSGSAGSVNLNYSGTQNITALYFGATQAPAGTYGASGTSATYQLAAFTGSGVLNVSTGGAAIASSTAVTLAAGSSNPSEYGVTESFTATVTGILPTGTVQFNVNGNTQGSPVTLTSYNATSSTATLAITSPPLIPVATSPYQIPVTAIYSSDANNLASTSPAYGQVVTNSWTAITNTVTTNGSGGIIVCWDSTPGIVYNVLTNGILNTNSAATNGWTDVGGSVSPVTAQPNTTSTCVTLPGPLPTPLFVLIKQNTN